MACLFWIVQPIQSCEAETNIVDVIRAAIAPHQTFSPASSAGVPSQTATDPRADAVAAWLRRRPRSATASQTAPGGASQPRSQKEAIECPGMRSIQIGDALANSVARNLISATHKAETDNSRAIKRFSHNT
jgi:hypothetical protein